MKFIHVHYDIIQPDWKVLHVGGGKQPFRRANCVIDTCLYSERNEDNAWVQSISEYFSRETWYAQNLEQTPWPFEDEEFDYVLIDDTIVSTRDPVAVCKEMERVGKRGYIEVPNFVTQHLREAEHQKCTGYATHRWMVDLQEQKLRFVYKHPFIHTKEDFWIKNPNISNRPWINPNKAVDGFFWKNTIECYEDLENLDFPDWTFEENIWKYKEQTKTEEAFKNFWSINHLVPVMLEKNPFVSDALVHISKIPYKFSVIMTTEKNERHIDMLKYEQLIAAKLRNNKNEQS